MRTKSKQFSAAMRKRFERDFRAQCLQAAGNARLLGLQDVAEYLAFVAMDDLTADHTAAHYAQRVNPAREKSLHSVPENGKIKSKANRREEIKMKNIYCGIIASWDCTNGDRITAYDLGRDGGADLIATNASGEVIAYVCCDTGEIYEDSAEAINASGLDSAKYIFQFWDNGLGGSPFDSDFFPEKIETV